MACLSRYPVGLRSCQNVSLTNDPADSPQTLQNVKGKTCSPVFFSLASQVRSLVFRIFRYRWRPKRIGSFLSIGARAQEWSALRPRRAAQSLRRRGRPRRRVGAGADAHGGRQTHATVDSSLARRPVVARQKTIVFQETAVGGGSGVAQELG